METYHNRLIANDRAHGAAQIEVVGQLCPPDRNNCQENVKFAFLKFVKLQAEYGEGNGANTCGRVKEDEVGLVEKAVVDHGEVRAEH